MADKVKTQLDRIESLLTANMKAVIAKELDRIESLLTASVKDVISKELDRFGDSSVPDINNILTIEDVCTLTGLSKARIYTLCSNREIPYFKQGKLYFKRKEVENWLTANRQPTRAEIESKAALYCHTH